MKYIKQKKKPSKQYSEHSEQLNYGPRQQYESYLVTWGLDEWMNVYNSLKNARILALDKEVPQLERHCQKSLFWITYDGTTKILSVTDLS